MNAVYTFWRKPFAASGGGYLTGRHFLSLLCLSAIYARRSFSNVNMFCCENSKETFEQLGLFDNVIVALDEIEHLKNIHWATAKLVTFSKQTEPFIHIDNDAYISKRLPAEFRLVPLIAQCPESYVEFNGNYVPQIKAIQNHSVHPKYWHEDWLNYSGRASKATFAHNTGIFGGCDIEAIHNYAGSAVEYMIKYGNDLPDVNTTIEQAYLGMFSDHEKIPVKRLISDWRNNNAAKDLGYCHYWGGTKRDKNKTTGKLNLDMLETRVKTEFPHTIKIIESFHLKFDKQ